MPTTTDPRTEPDPLAGAPRRAHLVPPEAGRAGCARILEARLLGLPLRALCGLVLVPSRDPSSLATCDRCLEVSRADTGADDGWRDA